MASQVTMLQNLCLAEEDTVESQTHNYEGEGHSGENLLKCSDDESSSASDELMDDQSDWGRRLPEDILMHIFTLVCQDIGCIPFLIRASEVCHLWNRVATVNSLWRKVNLSGERVTPAYRNEIHLRWLFSNKLAHVRELDIGPAGADGWKSMQGGGVSCTLGPDGRPLFTRRDTAALQRRSAADATGNWKIVNVSDVLEALCESCQRLRSLSLSGWKGLSAANLAYVATNLPHLSRLNLSRMTSDSKIVAAQSLTSIFQIMSHRLTHLVLSNNRIRGLPQIIIALSTSCPNLELLDISYLLMYSTALINLERFQHGCRKLKILRITNSSIALCPAPLRAQVAAPGFPALEELSAAGFSFFDEVCSKPFIDDNCIERILKTSAKLKLLDVRGHPGVSDVGLLKVPAWNIERLFLTGCSISRGNVSGLELIMQKWGHSLIELDLSWVPIQESLDCGLTALSECGEKSHLEILNLCGSSASLRAVAAVVLKCPLLTSLNLASCRALSRGMKRLYTGDEISELRHMLKNS